MLEHERIETTDAKAKEVRRLAERMITLGKRGDLHARRRALRVIRSRKVAAKVFDDLAERFRDREGGYTRVIKSRYRVGDAAAMSVVELVEGPPAPKPEKTPKKKAAKAKAEKSEAAAKKAKKKKPAAEEKPKKKATKKKTTKKKTAKKSEAKPASKKKAAKKTAAKKTTSKKK